MYALYFRSVAERCPGFSKRVDLDMEKLFFSRKVGSYFLSPGIMAKSGSLRKLDPRASSLLTSEK